MAETRRESACRRLVEDVVIDLLRAVFLERQTAAARSLTTNGVTGRLGARQGGLVKLVVSLALICRPPIFNHAMRKVDTRDVQQQSLTMARQDNVAM